MTSEYAERLKTLDEKASKDVNLSPEEIAAKLEAAALEQEEADLKLTKKWAGAIMLGPLVPAIFAVFTIATGQGVLNSWRGKENQFQCGFPLDCK